MDGADGYLFFFCFAGASLEEKMGTFLSGWLEDHAARIKAVNAAVLPDLIRIDNEDVKMEAASSAAQADHAL